MNQDFYRAFEDRHRGSREAIQERQRVYLDFLRPLAQSGAPPRLADLGCGRGEWLELLRAEGWQAQGVDLDDAMLAACRQRGLDVRNEDALRFLRSVPDASLSAISAFQVAEHLPFSELETIMREAMRVLGPGGILVLETPNPENLVVGSSAFYTDPTHHRPLPPALLAFLAEYNGFGRVATLRLHEGLKPGRPVELIDVLAGVSPDYAVVAQKAGFDAGAAPGAAAALDAAFAQVRGMTLNDIAERYDRQLSAHLRDLSMAGELARESSMQLQRNQKRMSERLEAVERLNATTLATAASLQRHAVEQLFAANGQNAALQDQIRAMRTSTSWRLTAPLRWIGVLPRLLREHGPAGTVRRAARKGVTIAAHAVARALRHRPKARANVMRLAKALGMDPILQRMRTVPPPPVIPQEPTLMPASARRVHENLKSALARRAENKEERVADRH